MSSGERLRSLLSESAPIIVPGAADAWTARLIARIGFPAVYASGAGIANAMLGVADIGLTTQTEMVEQVGRIVASVSQPILADADTGFGGVANVVRTVELYERLGVAGLHLEDQVLPKRCGHFDGSSLVEPKEMVVRLRAALTARADPSLMVFARTDARATEGLRGAIERAYTYLEAGADGLFVEALRNEEEFAEIGETFRAVPLIANMVEGGKSPLIAADRLGSWGYSIVLHANLALRLGAWAISDGLGELLVTGSSAELVERAQSWSDRQALVGLERFDDQEERVRSEADEVMSRMNFTANDDR